MPAILQFITTSGTMSTLLGNMALILEIERLTKTFGGLIALDEVSFDIKAGETLGLIGPNGSGKSTVFNVVTGIYPPDAGKIRFCGEEITAHRAHDIAGRGIARTFQLVKSFLHLTALQNVTAGRVYGHEPAASYAQAATEAQEILVFIGLEDKQHVEARSLPILERKRLELGRALATRPRLLLLDEFMSGLTPVEIQATISLITELKERGITIVVVEHIIKAVMTLCSRIIVLNAGQKIAEGSPKEISTDPTVITAYLGKSYVGD